MTSCVLVAKIITCTIASGTQLSPADAAKILKPYEFVYVPPAPSEPKIIIFDGGTISFPPFQPSRPLNCCYSYETNLRTGHQWIDGISVPPRSREIRLQIESPS